MTTQTERFKEIKRCRQLNKVSQIWTNSLTVVGILGVLVLLLSYFINSSEILLFGQILAALSFCVVAFFAWMILLRKQGGTMVMLILLGSGGTVFGLIAQIMLNQVGAKPPTLNMAGVLLAIGIITLLNKKYGENTRCEI